MKKACVVGYGAIGPVHAAALEQCSEAKLWAVCEVNKERAEKCKEQYGCRIYGDFDEMLKDPEIDVVHICTPHYLHQPMAKKALLAGKEVVLEKPAAMNRAELTELIRIAEETKTKVCVMLQNRTNNSLAKLHEIIQTQKDLGQMKGICAFLTWDRTPEYYQADAWRGKWATEGGGLLINQAIHTLDIVDWLGGGVESVKASISTKRLGDVIEVEDTADALLMMKNGCRGIFFGSNCYSGNSPMRVEVEFEKVRFRYADSKLYRIEGNEVSVLEDDNKASMGKAYWGNGHFQVIDAFYRGEENRYTDLNGAVHAMELLFAFYESAKQGGCSVKVK